MRFDAVWYGKHPLSNLLLPLAWVYGGVMRLRRALYRAGVLRSTRLPVPVIVVGNLSVGGTGKTPVVIHLVELLRAAGKKPGVVSRGYRGQAGHWPQSVHAGSDPLLVGDEPVLIAQRTACPVVVDPQRVRAARTLLAEYDCDVIIADDGLQHYALVRDVEIVVVDGVRRHGNGRCLPAGPLREPLARLRTVQLVMINGAGAAGECAFTLSGDQVLAVDGRGASRPLSDLGGQTVHAVAGIGRPARFFEHLRRYQVRVIEHPFPDHHRYVAADLRFADELPVLMTEKDMVKCRGFAGATHGYLPVMAELDAACAARLRDVLRSCLER